jgi:hypothetical protein
VTASFAPVDLALRLVDLAAQHGVVARAIGGVAIWLHTPVVREPPFSRTYEDVDLVVAGSGRRAVDDILAAAGLAPDSGFNAVHGRERRIYHGAGGEKVDAFIGNFEMCHTLPLEDRLEVDHPTVPLAELFLSKAQIFELNAKDARDLLALVAGHDVTDHDRDSINALRVAELCGRDWGLWRTTTRTIETLHRVVRADDALAAHAENVRERLAKLSGAMETAPKSLKWRARARVGDRVAWYELPEDPDRSAPAPA